MGAWHRDQKTIQNYKFRIDYFRLFSDIYDFKKYWTYVSWVKITFSKKSGIEICTVFSIFSENRILPKTKTYDFLMIMYHC